MYAGLDVLHMSASNETAPPRIRLSCDTRWQPAGEPRDPRLIVWRTAGDCGAHGEAAGDCRADEDTLHTNREEAGAAAA